ncbi:ABC transporter ATP-binding protein [Methylotuvimicrobium alcaliphilum]|uniref:ABC transporter related protein n=1 Tax=Methylotuvimicrobium alcaliphilum (strain DSM 19304 / NCIMB 14124 / VKM B-2133 / 20Z) TaxID=1091494 RepID=G4T0N3_META2|nr:ATP-binding cassette domain-containing protein [Methylotuvimicrobium alcaliphilum]CCE22313.1 ABC transporter related protein [Methylotuvimicrobium alcaliphilum 20Z]
MNPIIRFDQVSVAVREKTILSNISFALFPGEKTVLCGKSGSGKSSVLRAFIGLHAVAGGVYFQQMQLTPASVHTIRSATAYIGQEPILGAETVREALLLPFQFKIHRNQRPPDARLGEVLNRLHLTVDILKRKCSRISGGEKQRIALARGLLLGKSLYLLDEITSALDAESKQAVFDVFSDPQLTVLSVAHDTEWLARCDRILELDAGRLVRERTYGNA